LFNFKLILTLILVLLLTLSLALTLTGSLTLDVAERMTTLFPLRVVAWLRLAEATWRLDDPFVEGSNLLEELWERELEAHSNVEITEDVFHERVKAQVDKCRKAVSECVAHAEQCNDFTGVHKSKAAERIIALRALNYREPTTANVTFYRAVAKLNRMRDSNDRDIGGFAEVIDLWTASLQHGYHSEYDVCAKRGHCLSELSRILLDYTGVWRTRLVRDDSTSVMEYGRSQRLAGSNVPVSLVLLHAPSAWFLANMGTVSRGWHCAAIVASLSRAANDFAVCHELDATNLPIQLNLSSSLCFNGEFERAFECYAQMLDAKFNEVTNDNNRSYSQEYRWENTLTGMATLFGNTLGLVQRFTNVDVTAYRKRSNAMAAQKLAAVAMCRRETGSSPLPLSDLIDQARELDPEVEVAASLEFAISGWAQAAGRGRSHTELDALWQGMISEARSEAQASRLVRGSRRHRSRGGKKGKNGKKKNKNKKGASMVDEEADEAGLEGDEQLEDPDEECSVCCEALAGTEWILAACDHHRFHPGCLDLWRKECRKTEVAFTCPLCRNPLD